MKSLESGYLESVKAVQEARNSLLEAHNQLFEGYSKLYSAAHNFLSVDHAMEVIEGEVQSMFDSASADKIALNIKNLEKFFSVGRVVYKVCFSVAMEEIDGYVFYNVVRVSCDPV